MLTCTSRFNCCNNQTIGCKSAFETVNQQLLCKKKGIRGMACEWLKTFLEHNKCLMCALFHMAYRTLKFDFRPETIYTANTAKQNYG